MSLLHEEVNGKLATKADIFIICRSTSNSTQFEEKFVETKRWSLSPWILDNLNAVKYPVWASYSSDV